jgi:hypothetical protein
MPGKTLAIFLRVPLIVQVKQVENSLVKEGNEISRSPFRIVRMEKKR